jgi:hypothetical protein
MEKEHCFNTCKESLCGSKCPMPINKRKLIRFIKRHSPEIIGTRVNEALKRSITNKHQFFQYVTHGLGKPDTHNSGMMEGDIKSRHPASVGGSRLRKKY